MVEITDLREREEALDPARSFIVQAPAGSGKTTLLIQRYLRLLSTVRSPEQVLALTFTRKAAAEMHGRVVEALEDVCSGAAAENENEAATQALAGAVLLQDKKLGWNLLHNPARLNVRTIDSFCASITRSTPLLSRLGLGAALTEAPDVFYEEAARRTLTLVDSDDRGGRAIRQLLRNNDNSLRDLEGKLVVMLKKRDQWLRHVGGALEDEEALRAALEGALASVVEAGLEEAKKAFPVEHTTVFTASARYAANNVAKENPINLLSNLIDMPLTSVSGLDQWRAAAHLLLVGLKTKKCSWRSQRGVNVSIGFSADKASGAVEAKEGFKRLLRALEGEDRLLRALADVYNLPEPRYAEEEWQILLALLHLLPLSVAYLREVFAEEGALDFPAVSMAAIRALGSEDNPTDLMLQLDNTFSHILVDEYQDTSWTQLGLLRALTCGWESGDGRTLFIVGDPMQSIYQFRDADVGLFLRGRSEGVGVVRLEPLRLKSNFRSRSHLVTWANETFGTGGVFPAEEDVTTGAVPYSKARAVKVPATEEAQVHIRLFRGRCDEQEAAEILDIIKNRPPDETMAILFRSRSHVGVIVEQLKAAGCDFMARELVPLASRPVINDLLALQGALCHHADRVAWLSLLRARWCGLTLADMHALCAGDRERPLWGLMHDKERLSALSEDGARRLTRFREVMGNAMRDRGRSSARRVLEGLWTSLGGQGLYEDRDFMDDAERFFDIIEDLDNAGTVSSMRELTQRVEALKAGHSAVGENPLQVMTIHGAKGLEFDHVILPGLGRPPQSSERDILYWMERGHDLLLAPMGKKGGPQVSRIYEYLRGVRTRRETLEQSRLFYVAATRAAKELYLFGHVDDNLKEIKPANKSFLSLITHVLTEDMVSTQDGQSHTAESAVKTTLHLKRLSPLWKLPVPEEAVSITASCSEKARESAAQRPEFNWAGEAARHSGTVVHGYLYSIALEGISAYSAERVRRQVPAMEAMLRGLGLNTAEAEVSARRCVEVIIKAITDARGQWILKARPSGAAELPMTGLVDGVLRRVIIDRTFIDEKGVCWVIDYKTGEHGGGDLAGFLDNEKERYRNQLEGYAELLSRVHLGKEVRKGLYYPAIPAWIEW